MMQPGFIEVRRGNEVRQLPVSPALTNIGRSQDNQIVLDDPGISRHHAQLQWTGSMLMITDLGSNNGTMVNGLRIQPNVPVPLREGDNISIGSFNMVARLSGAAGGGETVVGGAAAYPQPPAYAPHPMPYSPQPPQIVPMQPQSPQVIRVEVPREAPMQVPMAAPAAPVAAPHKTSWAPWVIGAVSLVILIVLLNMPLCSATKVVQVDKPTTQTVTKTVMRTVTREVPETVTGEKTITVFVGYIRDITAQFSISAINDRIVDYTSLKNMNGLFDLTLTDVDGRIKVYRNVVNWVLDKTGQIKVPSSSTTTRTVTDQVPEQVSEQVTVMVKEDKETKVKVTPWQYMTGDY